MILLVAVDPDVFIEFNDRVVVDVMEACFADSKELVSVCENVGNLVYVLSLWMLSASFCRVLSVSGAKPVN